MFIRMFSLSIWYSCNIFVAGRGASRSKESLRLLGLSPANICPVEQIQIESEANEMAGREARRGTWKVLSPLSSSYLELAISSCSP